MLLKNETEPAPGVSAEEISALVLKAQQGDTDSFAEVLGILQARLYRHALFLSGNEQQALDLVQESVWQAWKQLQRYDGRASFFTWVCTIMLRRHYDFLRRVRSRALSLFTDPQDQNAAAPAPDPGESTAAEEDARLVRECLDDLPARQRVVVYLRFYAGEPLEGIAATVGCSVGTVKSRLFHALQRLAKMQKLRELRNELHLGKETIQ